jgi:Flp pilus assembly protein TadG
MNRSARAWLPRWWSSSNGAAAVEFALVLPLLLLLTVGMIDAGLLLHRASLLAGASREGARVGVLNSGSRSNAQSIETTVRSFLARTGTAFPGLQVTVRGAGGQPGTELSVLVRAPHRFLLLGRLVPGVPSAITLRASTVMAIE